MRRQDADDHLHSRPFDSQVREAIGRLIAAHLQPTAPLSWSALDFDFTGATLVNASFNKAIFTSDAHFRGNKVYR